MSYHVMAKQELLDWDIKITVLLDTTESLKWKISLINNIQDRKL